MHSGKFCIMCSCRRYMFTDRNRTLIAYNDTGVFICLVYAVAVCRSSKVRPCISPIYFGAIYYTCSVNILDYYLFWTYYVSLEYQIRSIFTTKYVVIHNKACCHSQQSVSSFTTKYVAIHNTVCRHSQQSMSSFTTQCVAIHNKVCRHSQESMSSFTRKYVVIHNKVCRHDWVLSFLKNFTTIYGY